DKQGGAWRGGAFNDNFDSDRSAIHARVEALRLLAILERRARRYDAAAVRWRELTELRDCPPLIAREATEALAIYHEHRLRDLSAARIFAVRTLEESAGARADAARHRLARIERKLVSGRTLPFPSSAS